TRENETTKNEPTPIPRNNILHLPSSRASRPHARNSIKKNAFFVLIYFELSLFMLLYSSSSDRLCFYICLKNGVTCGNCLWSCNVCHHFHDYRSTSPAGCYSKDGRFLWF
ncbi:hypothetical protein Leryth_007911, partial [Lithospermum erythrorhizon]